jgi:hypothetical protein
MPPMMFDTVTLVNRTARVLKVTYDSFVYDIQPGENPGFPTVMVGLAKNQNPRMGTQDPYVQSKFESLVGVKVKVGERQKDPLTPINEKEERSIERINRRMVMGMGRHAVPIEGRVFHPSEIAEEDGKDELSLGSVFGEAKPRPGA